MVSIPPTATAPVKPVSPRHALLESLIGIVHEHVNQQFKTVSGNLAVALLDPNDNSGDSRAVHQRFKAGNMLRKNSFALLHLISTKLEASIRVELAGLAPLAKAPALASAASLTLVPYEEMNDKVAFSALSQPFDIQYSEALATLCLRLAYLMDRDTIRASQNPFRPEVFLGAVQDAWVEFEPDAGSNKLLFPLMKPELFFDMAPLYEALTLALVRKGGQPATRDGRKQPVKVDSHDATIKAAARAQAALTDQLRRYFASAEAKEVVGEAVAEYVKEAGVGEDFERKSRGPDAERARKEGGRRHDDFAQGERPAHDAAAHGGGAGDDALARQAGAAQQHPDGPAPHYDGAAQAGGAGQYVAPMGATPAMLRQPLMSFLSQVQSSVGFAGDEAAPGAAVAGPATAAGPFAGFAGMAGMGHAVRMPVGESGDDVELMAQQAVYLPRIKESAPRGSLTRGDEHTIDLLTAVFHTMYRDHNISREIRDMMGMLQIPVLKAALSDQDFFFEEAHPARRMIDLLSHMGWEQRTDPHDPLFQAVKRNVLRVGREADKGVEVFTEAVQDLEATIQAEEQSVATAIAAPIATALKQEKMAAATKAAKQAVALRISSGEVITLLETFLENKWVPVMTIAYGVEDDKPGAVKNATTAMDELIWSVKPKLTLDDRKQFIRKLPVLLTALNKWLDLTKWQDGDRLQFFAELAECHASIVRAPLELAPERQLEIAVQVAQKAAERRLELAAQTVPEPEPVADDAVVTVETLKRGMWLSFSQPDGGQRKVKLAWISPQRSLFIFSNSAREEAFSMANELLAQKVRDNEVFIVPANSLVERALAEAMVQAAADDAQASNDAELLAKQKASLADEDFSLDLPFLSSQGAAA